MAYRQIIYHIIFGTKYRKPTLNLDFETDLYRYIHGIIKNKKCKLFRINGTEDHLHILSDLHPTIALSDFIKDIKVSTNQWLKNTGNHPRFEGWQDKYGAFTCSIKDRDSLIHYIESQKEHHKKETFYDEFKRLLIEHDIVFDEKYLL